ncbi:hypothetical protein ACOME3_005620 [Neoechinorhynchus agilis]
MPIGASKFKIFDSDMLCAFIFLLSSKVSLESTEATLDQPDPIDGIFLNRPCFLNDSDLLTLCKEILLMANDLKTIHRALINHYCMTEFGQYGQPMKYGNYGFYIKQLSINELIRRRIECDKLIGNFYKDTPWRRIDYAHLSQEYVEGWCQVEYAPLQEEIDRFGSNTCYHVSHFISSIHPMKGELLLALCRLWFPFLPGIQHMRETAPELKDKPLFSKEDCLKYAKHMKYVYKPVRISTLKFF